ncbi:hypothetical protein [Catenulispora rubra]|uniref:hypothetical protein n=1 Tax=Catenulispora rubra TaxID=280293 RepID=UPI001891FE93|nr:hypothetical protein [Catenulispora rubra]
MADANGHFESGASWQIDDVPPQQDRIPPQFDHVPQQAQPPPEPRLRHGRTLPRRTRRTRRAARFGAAAALLVTTATLGLVEPLRLWNHGWSTAQHLRGAGAGRGVFTVASCGASHQDENQITYWDCTGTFAQPGFDPVQADVYDKQHDHAGVTRKAYSEGDGSIGLANYAGAGGLLGWWAALALGVFFTEAVVCFCLTGWILGHYDLSRAASLATRIVAFGTMGLTVVSYILIVTLAIVFDVRQG